MRVVVNHEDDIDVDDTLIIVVIAVDVATVKVSLFNVVMATNESLAVGSQGIVKFWKSLSSNNVIAPHVLGSSQKLLSKFLIASKPFMHNNRNDVRKSAARVCSDE